MNTNMIKIFADIALILTFGALLWYSLETRGMKNQLIRQNELSLRPCILISYEANEGSYFFISVGNGPALHVQLKEIPFLETEDDGFTYKSDTCDLIVPTGRSRVVFREDNGSIASAFHLGAIDPKSAIKTLISLLPIQASMMSIMRLTGKSGRSDRYLLKRLSSKPRTTENTRLLGGRLDGAM